MQRTFVGVDAFKVYQEIQLSSSTSKRVYNVVQLTERIGELRVEVGSSCSANMCCAYGGI